MKKRLLSLILAITVIASILPTLALTASAADVSYTYSFNPESSSNVYLNTFNYTNTNDMWEYAGDYLLRGMSNTYTEKKPLTYVKNNFVGMRIRGSAGSAKWWVAVTIKIPTAGTYTATLGYGKNSTSDEFDVYVLPAGVKVTGSESSFDQIYKLNTSVIDANSDSSSPTAVDTQIMEKTFTTQVENEERIVVFARTGSRTAHAYGYIANLKLDKIEAYTVAFDANGGDSTPSSVTTPAGTITLPDAITRDNYTFLGWSDGTNTYEAGASYTVSGNITLTAQWQKTGTSAFVYDFGLVPGSNGTEAPNMTYSDTNAMWQMNTKSRESLSILKYGKGLRIRTSAGYWASFKINVPASGKYKVSLNHYQMVAGATTKGGYGNVYLLPVNTADIEAALETAVPVNGDTEVAYASSEITEAETPKTVLREEYEIEKGEYILIFKATRKHPDCHSEAGTYPISFVLEGDAAEKAYAGAVALENNELTKGSSTTATIALYNTEDGSEITDGAEFSSSDTGVVRVNGNSVTAVGVGTAEITADYSGDISNGNIVSAKVTVVDTTDDSVIFGKATNIDSKIEIDGTLRRGDTVTLTAEDIEGYNFVGWKRGNSVTGKFIVDAPQKDFAFKVFSNAFVTAIYERADEESATGVEFWNKNGELVAEYTADEFVALSKLPEASLIGHTFEGWQTEDEEEFTLNSSLANGITRVVAKQNPISVSGPFVCDDVTTELDENAMPFNSAITASTTSSTFSCWVRNEMVVSYDKDYTYYVWGAAKIDNSKKDVPDDKKPIVILEEGHGAYMLEYDAADYEIVEAGIVASDSGMPTVESASEKHIAQNKEKHGQFAAIVTDSYTNVRGYVIYLDGADYKIAYSD